MRRFGSLLVAAVFLLAACVIDADAKKPKPEKERIDAGQEFPKEEVVTAGEFRFIAEGKYDVIAEEKYRGLRLWTIPISDDLLKQCKLLPKGTPKDWDSKRVKISCSIGLKKKTAAWFTTAVHSIHEIAIIKEEPEKEPKKKKKK